MVCPSALPEMQHREGEMIAWLVKTLKVK
jgi:hypothetical protein